MEGQLQGSICFCRMCGSLDYPFNGICARCGSPDLEAARQEISLGKKTHQNMMNYIYEQQRMYPVFTDEIVIGKDEG